MMRKVGNSCNLSQMLQLFFRFRMYMGFFPKAIQCTHSFIYKQEYFNKGTILNLEFDDYEGFWYENRKHYISQDDIGKLALNFTYAK